MDYDSDITASFHKASELVKTWGEAVLPEGGTVEKSFTIEGISLWNTVSPMLAFGHLSRALSHRSQPVNLRDSCRILAKKAKRVAFDVGMPFVAGRNDCRSALHPITLTFFCIIDVCAAWWRLTSRSATSPTRMRGR